jgi:hypothetical protein
MKKLVLMYLVFAALTTNKAVSENQSKEFAYQYTGVSYFENGKWGDFSNNNVIVIFNHDNRIGVLKLVFEGKDLELFPVDNVKYDSDIDGNTFQYNYYVDTYGSRVEVKYYINSKSLILSTDKYIVGFTEPKYLY